LKRGSHPGITSNKLKRRLKREFKTELNSAVIHSVLYKRRRQSNESSRQYIYAMQEIADQDHIEEDALVQYIIDGVQDDDTNKTILYSAKSIRELKKCFEIYDRIKERGQRRKTTAKKDSTKDHTKDVTKTRPKTDAKQPTTTKHCFNCGSPEHDVKNCTNADKGPKCFKCNDYGHIAIKCSKVQRQSETAVTVNCVSGVDNKFVSINVTGSEYHALVDTGSDVSLMRNNMYEKIGEPKLNDTTRLFTGLGNVSARPHGIFRLRFFLQEGSAYEVEVYVVPTRSMTTQLILGRDFLANTDVTIRKGRIEIRRLSAEEVNVANDEKNDCCRNYRATRRPDRIQGIVCHQLRCSRRSRSCRVVPQQDRSADSRTSSKDRRSYFSGN